MTLIDDTIYQNGVECSGLAMLAYGDNEVDNNNITAKVQPNVKFVFKAAYSLNDASSPVQVECKESFALGDPVVYLDQTINIK
jgi:hypothetical protein